MFQDMDNSNMLITVAAIPVERSFTSVSRFLEHQMTKLNIQHLFCVCGYAWTDLFNQLHE